MAKLVALFLCTAPAAVLATTPTASLRGAKDALIEGQNVSRQLETASSASYTHIGCYKKSGGNALIGHAFESESMTTSQCVEHCSLSGGSLMATHQGNKCLCNLQEDLQETNTPEQCDLPCTGQHSERCGGHDAFNVYELVSPTKSTSPEYVGCFKDERYNRVMTDMAVSPDMTIAKCRDHCAGKEKPYYSVQYSNECWCGSSYTASDYKTKGQGTCEMPCAGEPSVVCGGYLSFSLFGYTDLLAPPGEMVPEDSNEGDENVYPIDGTEFSGDGTYYGYTTAGNCAIRSPIPGMYNGMIPVALNSAQYGDSELCGACIEGEGSGNGAGSNPITGTFKGFVSDKCPECAHGDLDFAKSGDGRWDISWKFVPCPGGQTEPTFLFEGSNQYYWKLQPRGTKTPVETLWVDGVQGSRTQDNFFVVQGDLSGKQSVKTTTLLGKTATQDVSL